MPSQEPIDRTARTYRESPDLPRARHTLVPYEAHDPRRPKLEGYIGEIFDRKHAARVQSFMPTLLALEDRAGRVCAAAGYRPAAGHTLFLEHYLDCPVQDAIEVASGREVSRKQVVEVGSLASVSCRAACHLVALLPGYLRRQGSEWLVFTATRTVRSILSGLRAPLYELALARPERIAALGEQWGSYYETDPRVMAGWLPEGLKLPAFARAAGAAP